ncbi:Sbal_3080 family lipoprotein [Stutzerimonas nitrititolerans]|uniref:Sbal_3080 family lipoprotein n=1 Tax=Stutzerimonas nitrititolerans TaxID=2482751 RepID=UPI00289CA350|nr:Sbal_3080 family lipoprotein [Stutzerimonas nitrititolerans]
MKLRHIGLALAIASMLGCSIKQTVDPAQLSPTLQPEICMIAAPGVREGFTHAYGAALQSKGFTLRQLPAGSSPSRCPLSTTYTGTWRWDVALYMRYAEIGVFEGGKRVGRAVYDARSGGGRLDKFIDAESKIHELADELFPNGAALLGQRPAVVATSVSEAATGRSRGELLQELQDTPGLSYEEYQRRYQAIMEQ